MVFKCFVIFEFIDYYDFLEMIKCCYRSIFNGRLLFIVVCWFKVIVFYYIIIFFL